MYVYVTLLKEIIFRVSVPCYLHLELIYISISHFKEFNEMEVIRKRGCYTYFFRLYNSSFVKNFDGQAFCFI